MTMQFHHHGYVSGDPRILPAAGTGLDRPADLPDEIDVLIVGSGPAGMLLAAQMSQYPSVTTRLVEQRPGRLVIGQADGIQARSVETFQAFGFAERIVAEAFHLTAMNFWTPDADDPSKIVRTSRAEDDPHGVSEFPHLIVNQARVLDYFAEAAENGPARITPDYGWQFVTLEVEDEGEFPVRVTLQRSAGENEGEAARRAREVRRRLRRRPQRRSRIDRVQARRRGLVPRVGRHGRARRHRLPRHPHQVRHPVARRRQHPAHPPRGRLPLPHVRRPRRGARRRPRQGAQDAPRRHHRAGESHHQPLHARRAQRRVEQRLRGRAPGHRQVRRRSGRAHRPARPARVHRRRRVPHAQRQGRPGHERLDARRIQPRLEARPGARGSQPRITALDVLGRTPGHRAEPHRLRQGVGVDDGQAARGVREPHAARRVLRRDGRVPRRLHDAVHPVDAHGRTHPSRPRDRVPDRQALQVGPRHARRRRERDAPRSPPPRRRALAHLRLRRRPGGGRGIRPGRLGRVDGDLRRLAGRTVHARRCRPRQRLRREGRLPAALRRRRPRSRSRDLPAARRPVPGHRLREGLRRRPQARTSSTCAASTAAAASSS